MKISASKFTFEKSAIHLGRLVPLVWCGSNKYKWEEGFSAIGWCHAEDLEFRPRKNEFAVMFLDETTMEEFWIHVDPHQLAFVFKRVKEC